ncbi:hypothetical protein [Bythopirellula polymerisocia]|uniref:Uncharacterized protein n=1 Tax=Bythopirellula polymerisocia TaxID=2528003 RepID=A0A5C6CNT6_9BACT|nr:hypothetical protein [Bythopirellula polymerisocia]TWU26048.1 hypothetical protein Pla144_32650 [Bythopirellula polymerisocia]
MIRVHLSAGFVLLVLLVCAAVANLPDTINAPAVSIPTDTVPAEPAGQLQTDAAPVEPVPSDPVPVDAEQVDTVPADPEPVSTEPISPKYRFPNVHLDVSEELLNAALGSNTRTCGPFSECIRGSRYRGTSTRDAQFSIQTLPAEDSVALNLAWDATVNSKSHTTQRRTTVSSVGTTYIKASKNATFEDDGWHVQPTQATAKSSSRITGISSNRILGRRIAESRARSAASQQSGAVNYSVARLAERRTRSEFDNQTDEMLASWEQDLDSNFREPLTERGQLTQLVSKRSTDDRVELAFLQAQDDELGAVTELSTPLQQQACDLFLSLHQSAINNFTDGMCAGRLFREDEVADLLEERLGWKLAGLEPDDLSKVWSIDFAEEKPLRFKFHNGIAKVTLETRGFTVGDQQIPGARLQVAYELSTVSGELLGKRQGRIEITPLSAEKDDEKVGVRFQVFRSMLRRRFERVFPEEFVLEEFPTPASWPTHAALHFATASAEDEWLQLACDLPGKEATHTAGLVAKNSVTE